MKIINIPDQYPLTLLTKVRDVQSSTKELHSSLYQLGNFAGQKIIENFLLEKTEIITPMNQAFQGFQLASPINVVISTKDDYEFFGKGIAKVIRSFTTGYIDYGGTRGSDVLKSPIREISWDILPKSQSVDTVVIAKSVMATGCTAISLAQSAISEFQPNRTIIVSAFYSIQGIKEILDEIPNAHIICFGDPDELDENNYLVPGVGNLDDRMKESA